MFSDIRKRSRQGFRAEFVPGWIQYVSIYIYTTWKAIFAGSPLWFTATNPGFPLGGLYPSSKREILKQLPECWLPKTYYIDEVVLDQIDGDDSLIDRIHSAGIEFPIVLKPDNGLRGLGVEVVHTTEEFQRKIIDGKYFDCQKSRGAWLVQEFINYPLEVGVFYTRMPGEESGTVTGIVAKEFLQAVGDGVSTLGELVKQHSRATFHTGFLRKQFADTWVSVIPEGHVIDLVEIGTHSRGSTFVDASEKVSDQLVKQFDAISSHIAGFYYGRYDVRIASWQALEAGDFKIIELNATYSEPTRMYDPGYSFWQAQKILLAHWSLMYQIAIANHKNGTPYATVNERKAMKAIFKEREEGSAC